MPESLRTSWKLCVSNWGCQCSRNPARLAEGKIWTD
ncbi:hypothetical protein Cantr_09631 [Candida viswanathii]|uniref:Uncharacterized protein n=1 Tax=Candida viswanathii TaxID=5486 RepID=A0A367YCX6_9ASCO|nr:hypothetical protein Cantr_09631 [Candida viswanathii]